MGAKESSNIFDEAGKKKDLPPAKKEEAPSSSVDLPVNLPAILSDEDIQEMFDRMIVMRQELDRKTDELKDALALTKQDINVFFSDPKNFTPEQWKMIQENRTELELKTFAIVGKDPKKVRQKQLESKDAKARKGKTLGARRNWIPIR